MAGGKGLTSSPLYDFQCCLPVGPSFPTGSRKALPFPTQGIGKRKVSFRRLELSLELTSPKFRQNESERVFLDGLPVSALGRSPPSVIMAGLVS